MEEKLIIFIYNLIFNTVVTVDLVWNIYFDECQMGQMGPMHYFYKLGPVPPSGQRT